MKPLIKRSRQNFTTKLLILFFAGFMLTLQSCGQETKAKTISNEPDYSNVDYSARSNIIKRPKELKGDEKAIFYASFFLKLTSKQTKALKPLKIKAEFAKLGITIKENDRFLDAYSFFSTMTNHKKSRENFAYFDFLKPKSKN